MPRIVRKFYIVLLPGREGVYDNVRFICWIKPYRRGYDSCVKEPNIMKPSCHAKNSKKVLYCFATQLVTKYPTHFRTTHSFPNKDGKNKIITLCKKRLYKKDGIIGWKQFPRRCVILESFHYPLSDFLETVSWNTNNPSVRFFVKRLYEIFRCIVSLPSVRFSWNGFMEYKQSFCKIFVKRFHGIQTILL